MNRHLAKILMFCVIWMSSTHDAEAWSSRASQTAHRILLLERRVEEFRAEHGRLPGQEAFKSFLISDDDPISLHDDWHRDIIYRVPGVHGEFDLHSPGEDGVDNGGDEDDISNWAGVNDGYYWKRWWPFARSSRTTRA